MSNLMEADPNVSPLTGNQLALCRECGYASHWLGDHVLSAHGLTGVEYLARHPRAELESADSRAKTDRPRPRAIRQVVRTIGTVGFPMNLNVPASDCLRLPDAYRVPKHGRLAEDIEDTLLALRDRAHTYIYGRGGAGKDALIHAVSAQARWPADSYPVAPDADIQGWFFTRSFVGGDTCWEEGPLLRQLRDGYQPPDGGPSLPYLIHIPDADRATPRQAEHFRLILDSIEGRVVGPGGKVFTLFPGTVIVMTANTNGSGDPTGRFVSARPQDATLLERLMAMFEFRWMEWEDEVEILRDKFPLFVRECEEVKLNVDGRGEKTIRMLDEVGKVTKKIRQEIYARKFFAEFSHRHLCYWLQHAERRMRHQGGPSVDLLARSAKVWLSRIGDERSKMTIIKIMDAEITGSMLGRTL